MDLVKRLQNIDRKVIYITLLILVAIPILRPFNLPVGVTREPTLVYEAIEALQPGDVAAVSFDYSPSSYSEQHPQAMAVMKHLMSRPGVKIMALAFWDAGPVFAQEILTTIDTKGKTYGNDFVNLGYIPGGETAMSAVAADIHKSYPKDYLGQSIESLPMMASINTAKDIKLLVSITAGTPGVPELARQIQGPYGTKLAAGLPAISVPIYMPYLNSGQMVGLLGGLRGAAEYEILSKTPGKAIVAMDALSASHIVMIAFVLIGNVAYFIDKARKGNVKR